MRLEKPTIKQGDFIMTKKEKAKLLEELIISTECIKNYKAQETAVYEIVTYNKGNSTAQDVSDKAWDLIWAIGDKIEYLKNWQKKTKETLLG